MKRVKVKPRKVNIEAKSFLVWGKDGKQHTKIVYAGDSLHTVPCPEHIARGMRQNLRRAALGVTVVSRARRTAAWDVMKDCKITTKRAKRKSHRRKAS